MESSPFPFQGPLEPVEVHGRDGLLSHLVDQVTRRRVTALIGPRRYGKTSVLRRLAADLTEVSTVWVDLYGVASSADLAIALDTALVAAGHPAALAARELSASVQVDLGVVRATLARPVRSRPDPDVLFPSLLDLLVRTALRTPTLLVLDEFSAITAVDRAVAKLRTALQHHYRDIGVVFAGSAPSVMRSLFTDRAEPFYGQADLIEIEPLAAAAVHRILAGGFEPTGRDPGVTAARTMDLTGGHPQRTMQVADAVWHRTPARAIATDERWAAALSDVRRAVADPMSRIYDAHTDSERKVLRILANGEAPHGAAGRLLGLAKASATHARDALLADGDLVARGGGLVVTDPLLADWLRQDLPLP